MYLIQGISVTSSLTNNRSLKLLNICPNFIIIWFSLKANLLEQVLTFQYLNHSSMTSCNPGFLTPPPSVTLKWL